MVRGSFQRKARVPAERKISSYFSELGVLCGSTVLTTQSPSKGVFAQAILPSVVTKNFINPKFQMSLARATDGIKGEALGMVIRQHE